MKEDISSNLSVKTEGYLDRGLLYTGTFLFIFIIFLATSQVFIRSSPLSGYYWTEPLSRYTLIVMTYVGVAIAVRNNENVQIDLLGKKIEKISPFYFSIHQIVTAIFVLLFAGMVFVGSSSTAPGAWNSRTDMPHITYGMLYLVVAISMVFMGYYTLLDTRRYMGEVMSYLGRGGNRNSQSADNSLGDDDE